MERAYVAGPYAGPTANCVDSNIRSARSVAADLWQRGYAVFCPHMNTAHMGGIVPEDDFLTGCLTWVKVAELMVLAPRWEDSKDTHAEIGLARELWIPIFVWDGPDKDLIRFT